MSDLDRAVKTVVERCLAVKPGEDVVVIVDEPLQDLGERLRRAAEQAGGDAVLTVMAPRAANGTEPPAPIAAAMAACDVFIAPASRSLSHTLARKRATEIGARGATLPGVTPDLLARLMDIDFDALGERSNAIAAILDAGEEAHVTCPLGSDARFDLTGRPGIPDDGRLTASGAFGNLPCGEGFISPQGGEGVLKVRSIASIGLAEPEPATLTIENDKLTNATTPQGERLFEALSVHGDDGRTVAELGVGTNDRAGLTGNVLEDEKIIGTVHVAFGASMGIGGTVSVPIHLDCVVTDASLTVDGTPVLQDGKLVL